MAESECAAVEIDTQALLSRVSFRTQNYIESVDPTEVAKEQFDVILCLSTAKWIHVNFGDVGLKALFLKAHQQLAPNGIFVVETHPWKSHRKVSKGAFSLMS